jgi:hypothetical protein
LRHTRLIFLTKSLSQAGLGLAISKAYELLAGKISMKAKRKRSTFILHPYHNEIKEEKESLTL